MKSVKILASYAHNKGLKALMFGDVWGQMKNSDVWGQMKNSISHT